MRKQIVFIFVGSLLAFSTQAGSKWWWETFSGAGSVTLNKPGSYTAERNPRGAAAGVTTSTATQPPTVVIQTQATSSSSAMPPVCVNTATYTSERACPAAPPGYFLYSNGSNVCCYYNQSSTAFPNCSSITFTNATPSGARCISLTGTAVAFAGMNSQAKPILTTLSDEGQYQWGQYGLTTGATDQNKGDINTATLITKTTWDGYAYGTPAAQVCALKGVGWYLPALNELLTMYNGKANVGGFTTGNYWSSSEYSGNTSDAYYVNFSGGSSSSYYKNTAYYVRCVRND